MKGRYDRKPSKAGTFVVCFLLILLIVLIPNQISVPVTSESRVEIYYNSEDYIEPLVKRTYGGRDDDLGLCIANTTDGGYIIVGYTESIGAGDADIWLIKTNATGVEEWNRTFGGGYEEAGYSVKETPDGGFIIAGFTKSYGAGCEDVWVIKTDNLGIEQWNRTYGSIGGDEAYSVSLTTGDGYIITGKKYVEGRTGDVWLIRLNSTGAQLWNRTVGGKGLDVGRSVLQTSDFGFIIAGYTSSYGSGNYDFWLIKTNYNGEEIWNGTYGGLSDEEAYSIQQTKDGGYIMVGFTESYGWGGEDVWLVKTDGHGIEQWSTTYGDDYTNIGYSVCETSDGGCVLTGYTGGAEGIYSVLLIKTNQSGGEEWERGFGGGLFDVGYSVIQKDDSGYAIAGWTTYGSLSKNNFDLVFITTNSSGGGRFKNLVPECVITGYEAQENGYAKIFGKAWDYDGNVEEIEILIDGLFSGTAEGTTNWSYTFDTTVLSEGDHWISFRAFDGELYSAYGTYYFTLWHSGETEVNQPPGIQWWKTFPGQFSYYSDVDQTSDGGFIIIGSEYGNETEVYYENPMDAFIIKIDSRGQKEWHRSFGITNVGDYGVSVIETSDGGFAALSWFYIYHNHSYSYFIRLMKISKTGELEWDYKFGDYYYIEPNKVFETYDEGFLIVGNAIRNQDDDYKIFLLKIDNNGNGIWNRSSLSNCDYYSSMIRSNDGSFLILGLTEENDASSTLIMNIDENGNEKWNITPCKDLSVRGYDFDQTDDGGFIILGGYWRTEMGSEEIWLGRYDESGNELWNRTITYDPIWYQWESLISVKETIDGGYILAGYIDVNQGSEGDIWLMKLDKYGNIQWQMIFGGLSYENSRTVIQTHDGGYIIIGTTSSYGEDYQNIIVLKTFKDGPLELVNKPPSCDILSPLNNDSVSGELNIFGMASDPEGIIEYVELKINDEKWIVTNGTNNWNYTLDTTLLENGEHIISVRAFDGDLYSELGNDSITIFINNTKEPEKDKSISELPLNWVILTNVIFIILIVIIIVLFTKRKKQPPQTPPGDPREKIL